MFPAVDLRDPADRQRIADVLLPCLADLLDLQGAARVAHWHVRGPAFSEAHKLFGELAGAVGGYADQVAERVTFTLGGRVFGTARQVAERSRLEDYPLDLVDANNHYVALLERIQQTLEGLNEARAAAEDLGAADTFDLLTQIIRGLGEGYGAHVAAHLS